MPIYSIDRENESGMPQKAQEFKEKIKTFNGIIVSFAEHNGSHTASFKNILYWVSRIEKGIWNNITIYMTEKHLIKPAIGAIVLTLITIAICHSQSINNSKNNISVIVKSVNTYLFYLLLLNAEPS